MPLGGGHLAEHHHLGPDFTAGALVLERPLKVGETAVVEYDMVVPDGSGFHRFEQHLTHRTDDVLIWVRFDPEVLPRVCEAYQPARGGEVSARIDLSRTPTAHVAGHGLGPGTVGIRWEW